MGVSVRADGVALNLPGTLLPATPFTDSVEYAF